MSVAEAVARLQSSAEVEWAEPNLRWRLIQPVPGGVSGAGGSVPSRSASARASAAAPDDPLFPRLYGLERIGAPEAWEYTRGSNTVVLCVFDTGVDYTHPDLAANMWRNPEEIPGNRVDDDRNGFVDDIHGINVVSGTGDPMDLGGHGTHVAGTIGAVANNELGVSGVNWHVQILAVRVAREYDSAFTGDIVRGLDYLVALKRRGVNLVAVNHSWGGPFPSRALSQAFQRLSAADVINVCAAANDRDDHRLSSKFPNEYNYPGIIQVAATDRDDHLAVFTDFGIHTVDVAAPGVWIWSTLPGNRYAAWTGTSMATPHVTGAIGLLYSVRPDLTPEQARLLLMHTVDPLPPFDRDRVLSGGRINVARAVQWLIEGKPLPTSFTRPEVPPLAFTRVSRSPDGYDSSDASSAPSLSYDGRWLAFCSSATNLVSGDTTLSADIFLCDRQAGTTVRVTQTTAGLGADGASSAPQVSGDGRFVAFATSSHNLVDGDENSQCDILSGIGKSALSIG
jgi:subtilisin family serine protease